MLKGTNSVPGFVFLLGVFLLASGLAGTDKTASEKTAEKGERLLIIQPGYPGSTSEAAEFVGEFLKTIGAQGGPGFIAGEYHNTEKDALEAINSDKPSFGIVSLGFYLKHSESYALRPLMRSQPEEPFHVVALKGTFENLKDLNGKTITGTPLVEGEFVNRVLFSNQGTLLSIGLPEWKTYPVRFFSKGIRDVVRGRRDAVLLTDREYRGMKKLRNAKKLECVHTTKSFPIAIVVAFGGQPTDKTVNNLKSALADLDRSESGKSLLRTMGLAEIGSVDVDQMKKLEKQYRQEQ